jgi:CheY-like chemotaxis protein
MSTHAHVLVVEDDEFQRNAISRLLRHSGFEPLLAANYGEAMAVLEGGSDVIAVISDLEMPGPGGLELLAEVRQRVPLARRVLMSGSFAHGSAEQASRSGIAHSCLLKPARLEDLLTAIKGGTS